MHRHALTGLIFAAITLSACATATRGTHEMVKINSEPVGATAMSDLKSSQVQTLADGTESNYYGCAPTPCGINLPRKSAPIIEISKPGYQPIKFKVTSAVATSSTSVPTGAIIAGLKPGSQVVAGTPELLKRLPTGGMVIVGGLMSYGVGSVVDLASGANKSLAPNPVTAFLAPEPRASSQGAQ